MRTACFCFPGGNETPGFQMFLSGFVSIPPPKAGAPQGISLRAGPDRSDLVIIAKILIEIRVRVQILELELIQTQMVQKPMLREEVGMRVRCANKASAE